MAVDCLPCAVGNHDGCWIPTTTWDCCCPNTYWDKNVNFDSPFTIADAAATPDGITDGSRVEKRERGGQIKEADSVTDLESTGRKRAKLLFPIMEDMPCEWQGLKLAGGGVVPITGCLKGAAADIHHGPNKSTLGNYVGNVHRICKSCHNRWHSINDKFFTGDRAPGMYWYPDVEHKVYEHLPFVYATENDQAAVAVAWIERKAEDTFRTFMEQEIDKLKVLTRQDQPAILDS